MEVVIIDYGMSNLNSISRAVEECGADVLVSDNPQDLKSAERIILPGVGAFADGMRKLIEKKWVPAIKKEVLENRIPLLGICLGMQLLAYNGYEGGKTEGLGFIPGEVIRLEPKIPTERIPHVGWNEVYKMKPNLLFDNISDGSDFYFVHSYHFSIVDPTFVIATTPYCGNFVSAVNKNNIYGVQFHPEKSIPTGFQVLRNFLKV